MKKPLFTIFLLLSGFLNLFATENHPSGARSLALSNSFISFTDAWSTFHNQAGLARLNSITTGVFYESRFMVDELSLTSGTFVLPVNAGTFGLSFFQFGKGSFKENKVGLAFAKELSKKFSAGIQIDYFLQTFPENDKARGFATFEAGVIYSPNDKLFLGMHIFNPIQNGLETITGKQKMPAILRLGGHYKFDDFVIVTVETSKDSENPFLLKSGIEFSPAKNLTLRFGVSGKPVKITAGIGYKAGKVSTDIGFSYHGNLGVTPSVSLQFNL